MQSSESTIMNECPKRGTIGCVRLRAELTMLAVRATRKSNALFDERSDSALFPAELTPVISYVRAGFTLDASCFASLCQVQQALRQT